MGSPQGPTLRGAFPPGLMLCCCHLETLDTTDYAAGPVYVVQGEGLGSR